MNFFNYKTICLVKLILFINILSTLIDEIEPGGSSTLSLARGRSASVGSLSHTSSLKPIQRTQSGSISSLSSFSTLNEAEMETRSRARPSTSELVDADIREREPILENSRRVSFAPRADLSTVSVATNHGPEHLNPRRDGVFARLNRILFPAAVAVGAAAGAGAVEIINSTHISRNVAKTLTDIKDKVNDYNGLQTVFN